MNEQENTFDEKLDTEWFEKIEPLTFESFEYLVPDKSSMSEQKLLFMSGEIDSPRFNYPKLDLEELDKKEGQLLQLKQSIPIERSERIKAVDEIEGKKDIEVARQAYHWRLNQMIAEIRMLKASAQGNPKVFRRYSEFVYGKPEKEIFDYISSYTLKQAEKAKEVEGEQNEAAEDLEGVLPNPSDDSKIQDPTESPFKKATNLVEKEIADLVKVPSAESLDASEIAAGFEEALRTLQAEGWGVVVDTESGRTSMSVSQRERKVYVPGSMKISSKRFCELIVHEIGTHVARRINGERSKLMLLGLGLDRYDPGEEGIATMKEQVFQGSAEGYAKHGLYLGISLAYGLDGKKRGFREVFEVLDKYNKFLNSVEGMEAEKGAEKAKNTAWVQTVRIFRGTDGTAGTCFTKDLAYLEGNIGVWNVIEEKSGELHRFNVGKYDPANERHVAILDRLGVSDQDLSDLEVEEE